MHMESFVNYLLTSTIETGQFMHCNAVLEPVPGPTVFLSPSRPSHQENQDGGKFSTPNESVGIDRGPSLRCVLRGRKGRNSCSESAGHWSGRGFPGAG